MPILYGRLIDQITAQRIEAAIHIIRTGLFEYLNLILKIQKASDILLIGKLIYIGCFVFNENRRLRWESVIKNYGSC